MSEKKHFIAHVLVGRGKVCIKLIFCMLMKVMRKMNDPFVNWVNFLFCEFVLCLGLALSGNTHPN